jgi:PAS domain-containing protein
VRSSVGAFVDITERKEVETKLKETLDNLEYLVKERTAELEKACKSLKESERGLAEAQKIAHIGNWEWDIENDKAYWSDELYRIFKRNPQELAPSYNEYLNYVHPDDRDRFDNLVKESLKGKASITENEHRIVLYGGE